MCSLIFIFPTFSHTFNPVENINFYFKIGGYTTNAI
jgi:hypothetical protein